MLCLGPKKIWLTRNLGMRVLGEPIDDAEHTLFKCYAWHTIRKQTEMTLETELNPESLIPTMLVSKANWDTLR